MPPCVCSHWIRDPQVCPPALLFHAAPQLPDGEGVGEGPPEPNAILAAMSGWSDGLPDLALPDTPVAEVKMWSMPCFTPRLTTAKTLFIAAVPTAQLKSPVTMTTSPDLLFDVIPWAHFVPTESPQLCNGPCVFAKNTDLPEARWRRRTQFKYLFPCTSFATQTEAGPPILENTWPFHAKGAGFPEGLLGPWKDWYAPSPEFCRTCRTLLHSWKPYRSARFAEMRLYKDDHQDCSLTFHQ